MGAELLVNGMFNDVHTTMVETVCVYNGEPVYVVESQGHRVRIQYLMDEFKMETIDYREKGFKYLAPPLGYMNWEDREAIYLFRDMSGGRTHALTNQGIRANPMDFLQSNSWWLRTMYLGRCIKGEYPSFADAVKHVEEGASSIAFDRHYAVGRVRTRTALLGRDRQEIGVVRENRVYLLEARLKPYVEKSLKGSDVRVDSV